MLDKPIKQSLKANVKITWLKSKTLLKLRLNPYQHKSKQLVKISAAGKNMEIMQINGN